ncbi:MAG: hypothetical protein OFPII_37530 [Osedax symbiont Rs1]|nr:MAG: hypothetical protein OFPII_37530 [Osedax symbiont Rs1]
MQTDQVQLERIETYTASLPSAIQGANGAQFAMLLSLITANQDSVPVFKLPVAAQSEQSSVQSVYPSEVEVNKPQLVERLNNAIHQLRFGDFAFINSFIETVAETPRFNSTAVDTFEKVALMSSGKLMLDHIHTAKSSLSLAA